MNNPTEIFIDNETLLWKQYKCHYNMSLETLSFTAKNGVLFIME